MNKFKKLSALILSAALTLSFAGCTSKPSENTAMKDREGNDITAPKSVEALISLAPSTTQILIDLGLEENLVAVDKYSAPLLKNGDTLPQFDIMNPDAEQLANLKADLIFATGMSKAEGDDPLKLLKDMGAFVTYIPTSTTIEAIKQDIAFIAQITSKKEKGDELVKTMEAEIEKFAEIGKTITQKRTVYFEISAAPSMYSFGKDVFLNEIIELIGAKNILSDQSGWLSVTAEAIVGANPDVILSNVDYVENPVDEIKSRAGFDSVNAVKNNEVFMIDKNSSSYSNHKIVDAIREMANAVYPEEYKDK